MKITTNKISNLGMQEKNTDPRVVEEEARWGRLQDILLLFFLMLQGNIPDNAYYIVCCHYT